MILVTGATGNIGGELVHLLVAKGAPVRALVRDPAKAARMSERGVEVVAGEFDKPETIDAAMQGIEKVFLLSPSAPNQVALQGNVVEAAKRAGVRQIVKLSGAGAGPENPSQFARWHGEIEDQIRSAAIPYTFVRAIYFMQNFLSFAPFIAAHGRFAMPIPPDLRFNMVDARDLAAVSATVLTEDGHTGKAYTVTGPALLSAMAAAETLSGVLGKPVTYVQIPATALKQQMLGAGQPEWLADGVIELYANMDTIATDTVAEITGRPAISFAQFVHDNAGALVGQNAVHTHR